MNSTADHEFIEVKDRRWCTCCPLFQSRKPGAEWPKTSACPRNTPYAIKTTINAQSRE